MVTQEFLAKVDIMSNKEMIAERLVLVDQDGYARIGNGGEIGLNRLTICDDHGRIFMDFKMLPDGKPIFQVFDDNKLRAFLGFLDDAVGLFLCDGRGAPRIQLTVDSDGCPGLSLLDKDGEARAAVTLGQDDTGAVVLSGKKGKSMVGMMNGKNGPDVVLFDEKRGTYWEAVESKPERKPKAKKAPARNGRHLASKGRKGGAK